MSDPYGLQHPWYPVSACEMVVTDIDHSEGVAVDANGLIWCGGEEGQVYHCPAGSVRPEPIAHLPGRTLGVAIDGSGTSYWCDMTGPGVYAVTPDGRVKEVSRGAPDAPFLCPNFPAFLPDGHLIVSESGNYGQNDGKLLIISPDSTTRVLSATASAFTNGLCVSADGRTLYVVESTLPGISALTINEDGSVSDYRVLVELPGTVPDGLALDTEGRLYIGCWVPDAILVLAPEGKVETVVYDPERQMLNATTNIAFGGPGMRELYFANYGERHIGRLTLPVTGQPTHQPTWAR